MRQERKYQIRRLVACIILVALMTVFTSVLIKTDLIGQALDAEWERQDRILEEHFQEHGIGRLKNENSN